jgi:capsular polysaccharide transport system permease protein
MSSHVKPKRTSIQIAKDTVHALLMRELKTRFGASKLGYFWALAEPVAQASILAILFTLIGRTSLSGVPVALFLISGIMAFKAFSKCLTQLSSGITANKALFAYRQVSPIDPIITRLIIELSTFFIVYIIILAAMYWLGVDVWPQDILALITASLLLLLLAFGLALCISSAQLYWQDTSKLIGMVMTPMFFISGVFYCATMIPAKFWFLFTWNPIFHAIELSRDAFFASYQTPVGSWGYLALTSFTFTVLGLMLYRVNREKFVRL